MNLNNTQAEPKVQAIPCQNAYQNPNQLSSGQFDYEQTNDENYYTKSAKDTTLCKEEKQYTHGIIYKKVVNKEQITNFVHDLLVIENPMTLNEILMTMEKKLNCSFSQNDKMFIEEIYAEKLQELWLDEVSDTALDKGKNPVKLLEELKEVKSFLGCLSIGSGLPYNNLMKMLYENKYFENQENKLIKKFKITFQTFLSLRLDYLQKEIDFLNKLTKVLKTFKCIKGVDKILNIAEFLKSKENETTCFQKFLNNILNCQGLEGLGPLKKASEALVDNQDGYYLIKDIKDRISGYLKFVTVEAKTIDGRKLLEVKGDHIVVGNILENIEGAPGFSELEEIRFVNNGVIHIDIDLQSKIWHGKNIVLFTQTVIVDKDRCITWDVSGQDGQMLEEKPAEPGDKNNDEAGTTSFKARSGESGGNILILCEEIENASNIRIVSNGGKGEKGLDGGNGSDGRDGYSLEGYDFKKKFPLASTFLDEGKKNNLNVIKESVVEDFESAQLSVLGNLMTVKESEFRNLLDKQIEQLSSIYFESRTKTGCKILFSFTYREKIVCQSLLLHKGSDGELGKTGERGGLGGIGGFAGDIKVSVNNNLGSAEVGVVVIASKGEDGENGKSGIDGKPGKSGSDNAYMDKSIPLTLTSKLPFVEKTFPKYFSSHPDGNTRLEFVYCSGEESDKIYCHYHDKYGKIIEKKQDIYHVQCKNVLTKNKITRNQFEIQGHRKKTINSDIIAERYECKTLNLDYLQNYHESFQEEITYEEMLNEEETFQKQKITRAIDFVDDFNNFFSSPAEDEFHDLNDTDNDFIELQVTNKRNIQPTSMSKKVIDEHVMAKNKHKLFVLNQLDQADILRNFTLQSYDSFYDNVVGSDNSTLRVSNNPESYCDVESYVCSDSENKRLNIIKKLEDACNQHYFIKIFNIFLDDNTKFEDSDKWLTDKYLLQYVKHYNYMKIKKAKSMQTKFHPISNCIAKDSDMHNKLVEAITRMNLMEIVNQICANTFLKLLYEKYSKEVNKAYVCKSALLDEQVLVKKLKMGFITAINQKGPSSVFYREVVARLFETNLLIYKEDESRQIALLHNHNPSANKVAHVLMQDDQFVKLEAHQGMTKVLRTQERKGQLYNTLLFHVEFLEENDKFNEVNHCISEGPYHLLLNSYEHINKNSVIKTKINHMLKEDLFIDSIVSYFEEENANNLMLCSRLKKLKNEFIGYQSFLYYIDLHMKTEGKIISLKEFCVIINFILEKVVCSPAKSLHIISWIIASQIQTNWIIEFVLLEMELYFKEPLEGEFKKSCKKHLCSTKRDVIMLLLRKLKNDTSCLTKEDAYEIIELISHVPQFHIDSRLHLTEWKYYLKDVFWSSQITNAGNWSSSELKECSYYLAALENLYGRKLCGLLIEVIKLHSSSIKKTKGELKVMKVLQILASTELSFDNGLFESFKESDFNKWESIIKDASERERSLNHLKEMLIHSSNTSQFIISTINETVFSVDIVNCITHFLKGKIRRNKNLGLWVSFLLPLYKEHSPIKKKSSDKHDEQLKINSKINVLLKEIMGKLQETRLISINAHTTPSTFVSEYLTEIVVATVCISIFEECNKTLRTTQVLAVLIFLKSNKDVLEQIATGEGKSFVIVAVAIMKALSGIKIDIITSSNVLAKRDAILYETLFSIFNIKVGHNCYELIEERKTIYSQCQVVYGELTYFQRDYLLDRFYNKNILGDREYQMVVVDEVDSMLLDKGNNVLYLSHEIPGLDKLEPLFVFIWKYLNVSIILNDQEELFDGEGLKHLILNEMYQKISFEDIMNLSSSKRDVNCCAHEIWTHLINNGVIDDSGKVLINQYDASNYEKVIKENKCGDDINYLLNTVLKRPKEFEVPCYLKPFIEDHLEMWIDSAIKAINLQNNVDYVVDVDRSQNGSERNPNIIILDRDTGTDMTNSQWDQGLHQFLQMKHGCRVSPLSLKAVFISNVSYLRMYHTILGLTGTLGSMRERELLKEMYEVEFVTIPTAKPKSFTEEIPIVCQTVDEWATTIVEKVFEVTKSRSALIICNSLDNVFLLKKRFEGFLKRNLTQSRNIQTYTRDYEEFSVKDLHVGNIIISTNLAGRGTDIQLSDNLVRNGGLYVCLSFMPSNSRVEEQAFGRSARNGQPGSGQMIFKMNVQDTFSKVFDLKKNRDTSEIVRLSEVKTHYETKTACEEQWFLEFEKEYKVLRESKHSPEIKTILLMICLDEWAFWLEKSSFSQEPIYNRDLIKKIKNLNSDDFDVWTSEIKDPFQLTKLGLYYLEKDSKKALKLFNKVIDLEPDFSEAAHYYKVCALTAEQDVQRTGLNELVTELKKNYYKVCALTAEKDVQRTGLNELITELKKVEKILKKRREQSLLSGQVIDFLKTHNTRDILKIDSYKQQQTIVSQMYNVLIESVYDVIGYPVTNDAIQCNIDPKIFGSFVHRDLEENKIIIEKLKEDITETDLNFSIWHGISPRKIKTILDSYKHEFKLGIGDFVMKILKKECLLPSRELFWKELISVGILTNEKKYVFVNLPKLYEIDPTCADKIKDITTEDTTADTTADTTTDTTAANKITLYMTEELESMQVSVKLPKDFLKSQLKTVKYKFLKKENILIVNKEACFSKALLQNVKLGHFDSVTLNDFLDAGIPRDTASSIISILVKEKVISVKKNSIKPQYVLLINWEERDKIELTTLKQYLSDVMTILSHHFSFRIAIQKLQNELSNSGENCNQLVLPLEVRAMLEASFWFDMLEKGILEKQIDIEKIDSGKLEEMYSLSLPKERYVKIFSMLYDIETSNQIVSDLIDTGFLKYMLEISLNSKKLYSINHREGKKEGMKEINIPQSIKSENVKENIRTIKHILQIILNISSEMAKDNVFMRWVGNIYKKDTPRFSLRPLEDVLKENNVPTSEMNTFTVNGFDHVIAVEEKKYTLMMKVSATLLTAFALAQIAAGVALQCYANPIGTRFVSEGINDMIFVTECVITGYLVWESYLSSKALSLISSCISMIKYQRGKSALTGSKSVKQVSSSHLVTTLNSTNKGQVFTEICKRTSVYIVEAGLHGVANVSFNYIQSQSKELAETITSIVNKDIEKTIVEHSVFFKAETLYKEIGVKAEKIISEIVDQVVHEYKKKIETTFKTINLTQVLTLVKRLISKGLSMPRDVHQCLKDLELLNSIFKTIKNCISSSQLHLEQVIGLVNNILNGIESKISQSIKKQPREIEINQNELSRFKNSVLSKIKDSINSVFSTHIQKHIITPILQNIVPKLHTFFHQRISKARQSFLSDVDISLVSTNNSQKKKLQKRVKKKVDKDVICDRLLKAKMNKKALEQLIPTNAAVKTDVLEVCCKIISLAFKEEGVRVPPLIFEIEKNDSKKVYSIGNVNNKTRTVKIKQDLNTTFRSNVFLLEDVFKYLTKQFFDHYPKYNCPEAKICLDVVLEAMHTFLASLHVESPDDEENHGDTWNWEEFIFDGSKLKTKYEEKYSYQHNKVDEGWTFSSHTDVDLRDNYKRKSPLNIKNHINDGFKTALRKVNLHIHRIQRELHNFYLVLDDFAVTKNQIAPPPPNRAELIDCYAIQYELIVPVMLKKLNRLVDFNIVLRLENKKTINKSSPLGPHIVYEINPVREIKFLHKGLKGHILLNIDCIMHGSNLKDCHAAGELIMPSAPLPH